ncbi:hypothetical protein AMAG_08713 [Allomyces macrogynus ATCC 38327]|uniref:Uncharacterized protein n=1 Tax=Allomyces macrogynus (strain ATCC 38327) TaxID=578462 RepID=A0A0L0SM36_ALLM3|nr:hypothetical protein AMAG_08713 [Allomyces macrogynus ATCC 38327]|eukprot:KNE63611.1 hypothetical protein AMAG_08713 [Allomyces macrogynus ATCC 38327]
MGINMANHGGTIYFLEQFDAGDWLALVQTFKIVQSVITPSNLVLFKDPRVKQFDLSSLKIMSSGAAPLSAATQKRAIEILNGSFARMATVVGLDPETHKPLEVNTMGSAGPGELAVRIPSVYSEQTGYYNRPVESKAAFITIGCKSWFRTGDLLRLDADGCLTVVDWCKEILRVNGNQLSEILMIHDILDVAIVPVPVFDE